VNPDRIASLVEPDRVHRDAYVSETVFRLECERLFRRAWIYVGHDSLVPHAGDYATADVAGQPLLMVRQSDGAVAVMLNRCAHKGSPVVSGRWGHVDRVLRCPYHSWSYRLDGSLLAVPVAEGYAGTRMRECDTGRGLSRVSSAQHRGFVFARLAAEGIGFEEYFGEMLGCIDAIADRSPVGELQVAGPPLRSLIRCNWKIYLENIPDALHASVTHESSVAAADAVWEQEAEARRQGREAGAGEPAAGRPTVIEQLSPFGSGSPFMEDMGGRCVPNGHVILGVRASLHSGYSAVPAYEAAMRRAYGEERAARILSWNPQNALLYPSLALKAAPQTVRVVRPLAVDRTVVEIWAFRAREAPAELLERTRLYNRLVFSPMSMVAHDDVHVFEGIQRALAADANPWVSLHRNHRAQLGGDAAEVGGLDEALMRHQFAAWARAMSPGTAGAEAAG